MENLGTWDKERLILELTQGKILANELKLQLNSGEACVSLLEKVISSYDNALAQLNAITLPENDLIKIPKIDDVLESPHSKSERTGIKSKDQQHQVIQVSKKRKTLPKLSERVIVRSEIGFEGRLEDGYSWRKYGQKDILGAIHPRAYYRCTYRHSQGCCATKLVQRADDDPTMFEVVYRGNHSCRQEKLKQNLEDGNLLLMKDEEGHEYSQQSLKALTPIQSENHENKLSPVDFRAGVKCLSPFISSEASESYLDPTLFDFLTGDQFFLQGSDFSEMVSDPNRVSACVFGDIDDSLFHDGI